MTVSLLVVQIWMFLSLALLCAIVSVGLRADRALAWLAGALLFAGTELGVLLGGTGTPAEIALTYLLTPSAYLCTAQAFRVVFHQRNRDFPLSAAVAVLIAIALTMLATGTPPLYHKLIYELACALAVSASLIRYFRAPDRLPLDRALIAALGGVAILFVLRIPLFYLHFDATASFETIQHSALSETLLLIESVLVPTGVFLLIAKVVGRIIASYRIRSERDDLTGLFNRRAFFDRATVTGAGGAAILCDIDHFKRVNDRYGHPAGDAVLQAFAALLAGTGHDTGRLGGEEFALLLPGATLAEATRLAEALRAAFHRTDHFGVAADDRLSASFGIAEYAADETASTALARADSALYSAKAAGRNRVAFIGGAGRARTRPTLLQAA